MHFKPLLDFEKFHDGTPRAVSAKLRAEHRIPGRRMSFQPVDTGCCSSSGKSITCCSRLLSVSSNFEPLLDDFPPPLLLEQQERVTFMDPRVSARIAR